MTVSTGAGHGDADAIVSDPDLARFAPSRMWHWLVTPLALGLIAVLATIPLVGYQVRHGFELSDSAGLAVALGVFLYAAALAWSGRRAWATFTVRSIRTFIAVQVIGGYAVGMLFLVAGIVAAIHFFLFLGLWSAAIILPAGARNSAWRYTEVGFRARSVRGALLIQAAVAIVLPPLVAVIAAAASAPTEQQTRYTTYAIIVPVLGAVGLVVLLVRGRSDVSAATRGQGDIYSERIVLHPLYAEEAARIVAGRPLPGDAWHPEYPFVDELDPLRSLARRSAAEVDPVFGMYMIRTRDDGLAVGGIGFFGPPDADGVVEVGYGLVEAARGRGIATDALRMMVNKARRSGALRMVADTNVDNTASRRVLERAGFGETRAGYGSVFFARDL